MAPTDDFLEALRNFNSSSLEGNEADRVRVREALTEVLRQVQSPWDVAWEHNWVTMATTAATRTLIDTGIFKKWVCFVSYFLSACLL